MTVLADPPAAATGATATVAAAASTSGTKCLGLRVTGPSKQLGLVVPCYVRIPLLYMWKCGRPVPGAVTTIGVVRQLVNRAWCYLVAVVGSGVDASCEGFSGGGAGWTGRIPAH